MSLRWVARGAALLVAVLFAAFPVYWMATTATLRAKQLYGGAPHLLPTFHHFGDLFGSSVPILTWLLNSAIVAVGTAVLSLVIAIPAAYALSRYRFRGRGVIGFSLFATQMLPEALLVVPLYALYLRFGLIDTRWSLVLSDTAFAMPVAVWILKSAIDAVPYEIEESARVDGCPPSAVLVHVTAPLIMPSIAAAGIISFFSGWNEYVFANTFISNGSLWPASKGLASFVGQFSTPLDTVMAAAILFALPAMVFFVLVQRRIVSGLTAGAVKG